MSMVSVERLSRIPGTLRYRKERPVLVPCRVLPPDPSWPNLGEFGPRFLYVELLEKGGGYRQGHRMVVGAQDVTP